MKNSDFENEILEQKLTGDSNSRLSVQQLGLFEKIKPSFDMITICGDLINSRAKEVKKIIENDLRINLSHAMSNKFVGQIFNNTVHISYDKLRTAHGRSPMRIEFNPNNLTKEELEFIQQSFLDNMRDKHFTRIDLAFDLEHNLEDYYIMSDKGIKKTVIYGKSDNVESKYFGVRSSDRYIRIYNKKKQLAEVHDKTIENENLWRIEFELKKSMVNKWDKCFDDLSVIKPAYLTINNFEEQAKIHYLLHEQNAWSMLSRSTKYKYKKILKEISDIDITDILKKVLNDHHDKLSAELKKYIATSEHDKLYNFDFDL